MSPGVSGAAPQLCIQHVTYLPNVARDRLEWRFNLYLYNHQHWCPSCKNLHKWA